MGKLIDSDAVVAMLKKQAAEWATAADSGKGSVSTRVTAATMSLVYIAAAEDVEKFSNEQTEGSVPTDKVE